MNWNCILWKRNVPYHTSENIENIYSEKWPWMWFLSFSFLFCFRSFLAKKNTFSKRLFFTKTIIFFSDCRYYGNHEKKFFFANVLNSLHALHTQQQFFYFCCSGHHLYFSICPLLKNKWGLILSFYGELFEMIFFPSYRLEKVEFLCFNNNSISTFKFTNFFFNRMYLYETSAFGVFQKYASNVT